MEEEPANAQGGGLTAPPPGDSGVPNDQLRQPQVRAISWVPGAGEATSGRGDAQLCSSHSDPTHTGLAPKPHQLLPPTRVCGHAAII